MKADYVHKDSLTATDYVELNKKNELLLMYNQTLLKENAKLKKQLEEYQKELEKADSITQSCIFNGKKESEISYRKCLNILDKYKTQQKEFIEYLENYLNLFDNTDIEEQASYDTIEEILQKYKEIIGDDKK